MSIFITSDTHFGHGKMKEYCGRPDGFEFLIFDGFKDLAEDDTLIHLGDVCIGNDERWHAMFIQTLPCKKILTLGNHDSKSPKWYVEHGWDFVCENFTIKYRGKLVAFSHIPMSGDFDLNVHGHFHNNLPRLLEKKWVVEGEEERNVDDLSKLTEKHMLICIENNGYALTKLDSLFKPA